MLCQFRYWQGLADVEGLSVGIDVIELEHDGIVLPAIRARMAREVLQ
jgi:hypothetical protein